MGEAMTAAGASEAEASEAEASELASWAAGGRAAGARATRAWAGRAVPAQPRRTRGRREPGCDRWPPAGLRQPGLLPGTRPRPGRDAAYATAPLILHSRAGGGSPSGGRISGGSLTRATKAVTDSRFSR